MGSARAAKPAAAADGCWTKTGALIAQGARVWDGAWHDSGAVGARLVRFPVYQSPRNAAGAPLAGDLLKCVLQSVDAAIYRPVTSPGTARGYTAFLPRVYAITRAGTPPVPRTCRAEVSRCGAATSLDAH